jgi:CHAD domain-containing protein
VLRLPDSEVRAPGNPRRVPGELRALLTGWVRTARLQPTKTERAHRTSYRLADADGVTTAHLTEELVSTWDRSAAAGGEATGTGGTAGTAAAADTGGGGGTGTASRRPTSTQRMITVQAGPADSARLVEMLTDAGATALPGTAEGTGADGKAGAAGHRTAARGLPGPAALSPASRSAVVLVRVLARHTDRLVGLDLPVRRGEEDGVHQMRVTCRRLRAALRTFRPLLAPDWAAALSTELAWLAGSLGAARDLEVLRLRVAHVAGSDPDRPVDPAALARIDELLRAREGAGQDTAARAMGSHRYAALLERVVQAGHSPAVSAAATAPAEEAMLPLVAAVWRKLAKRARALGPHLPDEAWHQVRILGKRARYACEDAELAFGRPPRRLARRLTWVQDHLGEHQDAIIAVDTLLELAGQHPSETDLAVACGRLVEREYGAARAARAAFQQAWSTVDRPKYTGWLDR